MLNHVTLRSGERKTPSDGCTKGKETLAMSKCMGAVRRIHDHASEAREI